MTTVIQNYNVPTLPQLDGGNQIFWRNQLHAISKSINELVKSVITAIANIATNTANIATNTSSISTLNSEVTTLNNDVAAWTAAWTSYTPTLTAHTGTLTTASATGRYLQIGKTTFFSAVASITTNGTGAGWINLGIPTTAMANTILVGREVSVTGKAATGTLNAGSTTITVVLYDSTYPGANGANIWVAGVYESQ